MVDTQLQEKLGRRDVSGKGLASEAWTLKDPEPGKPRLRFADLEFPSERFTSAHEGAMYLGMGCMAGIRNWAAHTTVETDEQVALEYLAALSVFARWVEQAEVLNVERI